MRRTEADLRRRLDDAIERLGPWDPPDNIWLGEGVWTITDKQPVENSKLRRVVQLAADFATRGLDELRVLDLACAGGVHGIEFARRGAEVVAIEGRSEHVERARFVKDVLGLSNYEVLQGDVRHVTREKHGDFDLVLCLGILYHLDAPDVFEFAHNMAAMCRERAIVDTHISTSPDRTHRFREREYWARDYVEHPLNSSPRERQARRRASLDNPTSVWLTLPSLLNLLSDVGFTSVAQAHVPRPDRLYADRVTLIASKGARQEVPHASGVEDPPLRWSEREEPVRDPTNTFKGRLKGLRRRILRR